MSTAGILSDIVGINSVFPDEEGVGEYIEGYLRQLGFKTFRQHVEERRFNLFAERGSGDKAVLFYGHMDTVPIYGKWNTDPLKLSRSGDKLYGVGSCDMKGGIAAVLEMVSKIDRRKRIKLLFCVDEENISRGIWTAVKRRSWFDDVCFIISVEPGDSPKQTGGANVITVGRRGRVVLSLDIQGLSSHGANPQRGINALDQAAKIAVAIKRFDLGRRRGFGSEAIFVNTIDGRSTSLSVPDKAHMEIDVQLVPPNRIESAKSRMERLINSLYRSGVLNRQTKISIGIRPRPTPYINPYANNLNNRMMRRVFALIKERFGSFVVNYGSSVADDNVLFETTGAPTVTIGPRGGNIHTANEWVSRESLEQITGLYRELVDELLKR